ncbi:Mn2+/Fe2+ NRAMP family transporter OS=Streptomyces griseomycini OX=66895 GN=FHS37_001290 PE=4 SV=1 [Streptomyces griseomycini]
MPVDLVLADVVGGGRGPFLPLFPDVMDLEWWGVACGVVGLVFVWFNKYAVFEKVMTVLVGVMFVVTVYLAIVVTPNLGDAFAGLLPVLPDEEDSVLNTLGLIGGVGGTITLAAYGYWVNAKGWTDAGWMKVMRLDNRVAYITTGVFVVAMLIVGAEPAGTRRTSRLSGGGKGLVQTSIGDILADEYGHGHGEVPPHRLLRHVLHLAHRRLARRQPDVRRLRGPAAGPHGDEGRGDRLGPARTLLALPRLPAGGSTFPPVVLLFQGEPFRLVIVYGVLGAAFMPFLALTLIWLLNVLPHTERMAQRAAEQRDARDRRPGCSWCSA